MAAGKQAWWRLRRFAENGIMLDRSLDRGTSWSPTAVSVDSRYGVLTANAETAYAAFSLARESIIVAVDGQGSVTGRWAVPDRFMPSAFSAKGGALAIGTVAKGVLVLERGKWREALPPAACATTGGR